MLVEVQSAIHRQADAVSHRHVLGALLKGGGIDRSKVGDLVVSQDGMRIAAAVTPPLADAACLALPGSVALQAGALASLVQERDVGTSADANNLIKRTVPSMRADALVAAAFDLSRAESRTLAERGYISANWVELKPDAQLNGDEIVTVRGYGRFTISDCHATKKDRRFVRLLVLS